MGREYLTPYELYRLRRRSGRLARGERASFFDLVHESYAYHLDPECDLRLPEGEIEPASWQEEVSDYVGAGLYYGQWVLLAALVAGAVVLCGVALYWVFRLIHWVSG